MTERSPATAVTASNTVDSELTAYLTDCKTYVCMTTDYTCGL